MKNKQGGFVAPLLVSTIIILVLGVGIYVYTNETSKEPSFGDVPALGSISFGTSTATGISTSTNANFFADGWLIYRNSKYGFQFQYPKEWTLTEHIITESGADSITMYKNYRDVSTSTYLNNAKRYDGMISMVIYNPSTTENGPTGERPDLISSEQISIDGQLATRKITSFTSSGRDLTYKMSLKNNPELTMSISVYAYEGDLGGSFSRYNDLLDQVMKTFIWFKSTNEICNIVVTSFSANAQVSFPLPVTGKVYNSESGCPWKEFEGQIGSAQLYFNFNKEGWKPIGNLSPIRYGDDSRTTFAVVLNFNNDGVGISLGTPMKIVFSPENASAIKPSVPLELPVIYVNHIPPLPM